MSEIILFFELGLALILAKLFGELFERMKQPAVMGEILAGIIIGQQVLGHYIGLDLTGEVFKSIAGIGSLILLFLSGLEVELSELKKTGKLAVTVATGGVLLPFFGGYLVSQFFGYSFSQSLLVGVILTATSVGVTARVLLDAEMLNTRAGTTILGAAVIDDVFGILMLVLASSLAVKHGLDVSGLSTLGISIFLFFFITLYLGLKFIGRVVDLQSRMITSNALLAMSLGLGFLFGVFAEEIKIAAITGAFIAGLIIGETPHKQRMVEETRVLGHGFFIPLFFVYVGALFDFSALLNAGSLIVLVVFVAIFGKLIGCGLPAKLMGSSNRESIIIGVGMIPRMEIGLIVAAIGIELGMASGVEAEMLALAIVTSIVTGLLPLFFLRPLLRGYKG
ncbi:MAG: cation:proton antiporter [Candidatus Altiarchaeota archaeon]